MADARLQIVRLAIRRNVRAELVRRLGLADAGNVVLLALDGEQRDIADGDGSTARRDASSRLSAAMLDEHGVHGLQIELGGEVHDRRYSS
jgi:hypothetical protein